MHEFVVGHNSECDMTSCSDLVTLIVVAHYCDNLVDVR